MFGKEKKEPDLVYFLLRKKNFSPKSIWLSLVKRNFFWSKIGLPLMKMELCSKVRLSHCCQKQLKQKLKWDFLYDKMEIFLLLNGTFSGAKDRFSVKKELCSETGNFLWSKNGLSFMKMELCSKIRLSHCCQKHLKQKLKWDFIYSKMEIFLLLNGTFSGAKDRSFSWW